MMRDGDPYAESVLLELLRKAGLEDEAITDLLTQLYDQGVDLVQTGKGVSDAS